MKRIKLTAIVNQEINKSNFDWTIKGFGEIESYHEKELPKDLDILTEHSFEALWESTLEFANGIWSTLKGFFGMMKFAIIVCIEGLRWLWKEGLGSKDDKKKGGK